WERKSGQKRRRQNSLCFAPLLYGKKLPDFLTIPHESRNAQANHSPIAVLIAMAPSPIRSVLFQFDHWRCHIKEKCMISKPIKTAYLSMTFILVALIAVEGFWHGNCFAISQTVHQPVQAPNQSPSRECLGGNDKVILNEIDRILKRNLSSYREFPH